MDRQCLKEFFKMQPSLDSKVQVDQHSMTLVEKLRLVYWLTPILGLTAIVLQIVSITPGVWFMQYSANNTCIVWQRCVLEWNHHHPTFVSRTTTKPRQSQGMARQLRIAAKKAEQVAKAGKNEKMVKNINSHNQKKHVQTTTVMTTPSAEMDNEPELLFLRSDPKSKLPTWQIGCCALLVMVVGAACGAVGLIFRGLIVGKPSLILFSYHSAGELFFAGGILNTTTLIVFPRLLTETLKDGNIQQSVLWYSIPSVSFGYEYFYACIGNALLYLCALLMMLDEIIYFCQCVNYQCERFSFSEVLQYVNRRIRRCWRSIIGTKARNAANHQKKPHIAEEAQEKILHTVRIDHME